ncbi:MAG: retropepsin-like aspartic protease family protein [Burkholderiales bacterium]
MATGFTMRARELGGPSLTFLALLLMPTSIHAADLAVSALFNGKAVIVVDGGKPRTLSIGEVTPEGVKLVSASSETAVVELNGQRQTLSINHGTRIGVSQPNLQAGQATLKADGRGHFYINGWINGSSVRFLVDTGATTVALSTTEARRLGINYLAGTRSMGRTASGSVLGYGVKLDSVRVGDITLHNVDAYILEGAGPSEALLGMSFLNRTQMRRDGDTLVLLKRF